MMVAFVTAEPEARMLEVPDPEEVAEEVAEEVVEVPVQRWRPPSRGLISHSASPLAFTLVWLRGAVCSVWLQG